MQDNKDNTPTIEERLTMLEDQIGSLWQELGRLQSVITDIINMSNEEILL